MTERQQESPGGIARSLARPGAPGPGGGRADPPGRALGPGLQPAGRRRGVPDASAGMNVILLWAWDSGHPITSLPPVQKPVGGPFVHSYSAMPG